MSEQEDPPPQPDRLPLTRRTLLGGLAAAAVTPWLASSVVGQEAPAAIPAKTRSTLFPRQQHTTTALGGGYVLVVGGAYGSPTDVQILSDVQLLRPDGSVVSAAPLNTPRYGHAAVLLSYGRVLVLGGYFKGALDDCEIYDPGHNAWSPAASLSLPRYNHTALLVSKTQVLIVGGVFEGTLGDTEIYTL